MWITKERYYKIASRCNVKELRYLSWLYNKENKKKGGKFKMNLFGGFLIDFPKMEAKRHLPPNVKINPTKRLNQMFDLIDGK